MSLVSPVNYVGGKHYIRDWVVGHFDYSKLCYVELFGGGGHILMAKRPHRVEIFNDNDELLINFFKVLREDGGRLEEELRKLPYSRVLWDEFRRSDWSSLDDLEKAVRWYYLIRGSFAGKWGGSWSYSFEVNVARRYYNSLDLFRLIRERIRNVQIECRDYREIIKSIKERGREEDVMIYADPPYIEVNYYQTKWSIEDHKELAEVMNSLRCSIAISYYETEEIREWYPEGRWNYYYRDVVKYSCGMTRSFKGEKPKAVELLLTNYKNGYLI